MNPLAQLLGSSTRGNLVQALALSKRPLTSYRVAKLYHMNVAKVYIEMKKLAEMGLVEAVRRKRGAEYRLADADLKRLALRLSSRVVTFDAWSSMEAKKARFRMGLGSVPQVSLERPEGEVTEKPTRMPGELENLAVLGRKRFDSKYRKIGEREYGHV
jgi:DNA-binding transcriptional ArsR family regulator